MIKFELDMIMASPGSSTRQDTQATRHAEMNQNRRAAAVQQQVFAPPANLNHGLSPQLPAQPIRHRIPQLALIDVHADDAVPANQFLERPAGGLDFGKFRH